MTLDCGLPDNGQKKTWPIVLPELMPHAVSASGKAPFDIEVWTSDTAGSAFEAAFVADADAVFFQFIDVGGADI